MLNLQAYLDKLKPNVIVRGPLLAELVQVITTIPMGDSIKLIGTGTQTNQTHQPVLSLEQLDTLEFSPETEPFDGDESGQVAAEAMGKFGAQKNYHYFHVEPKDYKDKGGRSWDVEIEDMVAYPVIETFISRYPESVEEQFMRGQTVKVVINGKPVERDGQTFDYKMMLTDHVRQHAGVDDLAMLVEVLKKARKCMRLKN